MNMPSKFGHDTLIPLSFVLILLGGAFWLTEIYAQGNANAAAISKNEIWQHKIEQNLYLIMGALNIKEKKNDD